mmetsp:Transcript_14975/g.50232  ORF Transcript_14975/g.50232 Transcript_14975/m.50232 type:complete len:211 (-) Transcript_14975:654-1286(-)
MRAHRVVAHPGRLDEAEDDGNVVSAVLALDPQLVRLADQGLARLERVRVEKSDVDTLLRRDKLENPVRRHHDHAVPRADLVRVHLRLGHHSQGLGQRVADAARERCAGVLLLLGPDARRVAAVVDLVAEVAVPVLVDGLDAVDLVRSHHARAVLLHALALVASVRRLVQRKRLGDDAAVVADAAEHAARVADVGDGHLATAQVHGDGGSP